MCERAHVRARGCVCERARAMVSERVRRCAGARVRVRACVRACVRASVHACVHARMEAREPVSFTILSSCFFTLYLVSVSINDECGRFRLIIVGTCS